MSRDSWLLVAASAFVGAVIATAAVLFLTGSSGGSDSRALVADPTSTGVPAGLATTAPQTAVALTPPVGQTPAGQPSPSAATGSATTAAPTAAPSAAPVAPESRAFYEAFLAAQGLVLDRDPEHADVTGDGNPEVLLTATESFCVGCQAKLFFVMSGPDAVFQGDGFGWLAPLSTADGFERVSPLSMPGHGACCPPWFYVTTYRFANGNFVADADVGLRHFLEVNSMPVTGPLDPPEQVAAVVLHYNLLSLGQHAQAYALFSQGFKAANPYQAWSQGFATTESVFVQAAALQPGGGVSFTIRATDSAPSGGTSEATYQGTWELVQEGGAWKLHSASIQLVP